MASSGHATVALLTGSLRGCNNGDGITAFFTSRWNALAATQTSDTLKLALAGDLMPKGIPLPLGPILEPTLTHAINTPEGYSSPAVQAWSRIVTSAPAVVIVTPQYNWGYPGQLKNLLDQLLNEWKGKPFLLVTYGGHGGNKAASQLASVIEGGLHGKLIEQPIMITLPPEYIRGASRVQAGGKDQHGSGTDDEFLRQYIPKIDGAIIELFKVVESLQK